MQRWSLVSLLVLSLIQPSLARSSDAPVETGALRPWPGEELSGGSTTVFDQGHGAFGRALENLDPGRWMTMRAGKRLFESPWEPSSTASGSRRGLGPRFNTVSCSGCHYRDGRGAPPAVVMAPPEPAPRVLRLRRKDGSPDPRYGLQLNDQGIGLPGEGTAVIELVATSWRSGDGRDYDLQRPWGRLSYGTLGALDPETRIDLRIPPTLVGLGLLEAVPVEIPAALADPDDLDGDGISGRLRLVDGGRMGRFGWTASQPDLESQAAAAFLEDLGVTSRLRPHPNCPQTDETCRQLAGAAVELSQIELERVAQYLRLLAPPARRDWNAPDVLRGREIFMVVGCGACHVPVLKTASQDAAVLPELAEQTIRPYTDLLLHDLGPELADAGREPGVEPGEWRTAPLWGLGLHERVNGHLSLLHDGRARSIEEAILWHGGEAAGARERFVDLSPSEQENLQRFLESL